MEKSELQELKESLNTINKTLAHHEKMIEGLKASVTGRPVAYAEKRPSPTEVKRRREGSEQKVGARWLGWIGFFSFIVGVGFFLRYAFEQGWITELARVVLGYVGGGILLGVGEAIRRKYPAYGSVIQGIGVAVLYLVTFAAFNFYGLVSQWAAFTILLVITAVVAGWGLRTDAPALLGASFAGAYCTPILIHQSGSDPRLVFFPYLFVLNAAVLWVVRTQKKNILPFLGFGATAILGIYWALSFYNGGSSTAGFVLAWLFAFTALFTAGRFIVASPHAGRTSVVWNALQVALITAAVGVTLELFTDINLGRSGGGVILLGYAVIQGVHLYLTRLFSKSVTPTERVSLIVLVFALAVAISRFVPARFAPQAVALGLEAVAVFGLGIWLKRPEVRIGALWLLFFGLLEAIAVRFSPSQSFTLFLTPAFGIRFFILGCAATIAGLYRRALTSLSKDERNIVAFPMFIVTHIGALWLFSAEIGRWFGARRVEQVAGIFDKRERGIISGQIANQKNIAISIFWGLYGFGALLTGFLTKSRFVRLGGLVLLIITIVKVFLYDFWSLGTVYRMIVALVLGVVFLLGSFLYHRFEDRLKKFIKE